MCNANPAGWRRVWQGVAATVLVAAMALPVRAGAISERYIFDLYTGLALSGYDPVTYFVEAEPRLGQPTFEVVWDGAYWRFTSIGNARAFVAAPQVYAPAYGGYNAVAVASGRVEAGEPLIYTIHRNRLFLFASEDDRTRFLDDPDGTAERADRQWPALLDLLSR